MPIRFESVAELADALRAAKDAHTRWEQSLGTPDHDWPTWYAGYMFGAKGQAKGRVSEATYISGPGWLSEPTEEGSCRLAVLVKPQTEGASIPLRESSAATVESTSRYDAVEDYWDRH